MRVHVAIAVVIGIAPACSTPADHVDAATDASAADAAIDAPRDVSAGDTAADASRDALAIDTPAVDSPVVDVPLDTRPADYGQLGTTHLSASSETLRTHATVNFRGVDVAYDPVSRAFLVVYGNAPIGGAFLDDDGHQIGDGFLLPDVEYDGSNWSQLPRVAYGAGAFMVTWHMTVGSAVVAQARRVRFTPGGMPVFDGPSVTLSAPGSNTNQESPAAIAFSPVSQEFLAVWAQNGLKARRVGSDGNSRGEVITISTEGVWVEQPSVVFDPGCGCFFVAYASVEGNGGNVSLARIGDGTGTLLAPPADLTGEVSFTKVTDVALDEGTGEVLASWFQIRAGVSGFTAQRFGADGTATGAAVTVFAPFGSYDGYDLAWSPATGTSFAAFHGMTAEAWGAELDRTSTNATVTRVTASGASSGFFLPHVVAHPERPFWLIAGSADYARVVVQRVDRTP